LSHALGMVAFGKHEITTDTYVTACATGGRDYIVDSWDVIASHSKILVFWFISTIH